MTLCVIGSEEEICFVSTCTCPTNRTRREIPSHLITENPISGPNIKKPTCSFKNISTKTISDKNRGNCTNPKDKMSVILKENSTIGSGSKEKKMRSYEEENKPHVSGIHSFICFNLLKTFMIIATLPFRWYQVDSWIFHRTRHRGCIRRFCNFSLVQEVSRITSKPEPFVK